MSIFYSTFSRRTPAEGTHSEADFVKVATVGTLRESASIKLVLNHTKIFLQVREFIKLKPIGINYKILLKQI